MKKYLWWRTAFFLHLLQQLLRVIFPRLGLHLRLAILDLPHFLLTGRADPFGSIPTKMCVNEPRQSFPPYHVLIIYIDWQRLQPVDCCEGLEAPGYDPLMSQSLRWLKIN